MDNLRGGVYADFSYFSEHYNEKREKLSTIPHLLIIIIIIIYKKDIRYNAQTKKIFSLDFLHLAWYYIKRGKSCNEVMGYEHD